MCRILITPCPLSSPRRSPGPSTAVPKRCVRRDVILHVDPRNQLAFGARRPIGVASTCRAMLMAVPTTYVRWYVRVGIGSFFQFVWWHCCCCCCCCWKYLRMPTNRKAESVPARVLGRAVMLRKMSLRARTARTCVGAPIAFAARARPCPGVFSPQVIAACDEELDDWTARHQQVFRLPLRFRYNISFAACVTYPGSGVGRGYSNTHLGCIGFVIDISTELPSLPPSRTNR